MSDIPIHGEPAQVLAFCKAFRRMQPKIPAFPRTRGGQEGNRTFQYTEYDKILEIVEPIFDEHGFFHFQSRGTVETANGSMATVDSFLLHEEGAYSYAHNEARVEAKNAIRDAGKAHTYFSRYGLIGLMGKTSETDQDAPDGAQQQAQKARQEPAREQPQTKTPPSFEEAQKTLRAIKAFIEGIGKESEQKEWAAAVLKHSVDAWASKPGELAAKGEVHKLAEVLRWAEETLAPPKKDAAPELRDQNRYNDAASEAASSNDSADYEGP